ncbi:MAG TPA: hypothetical protein VLF67_05490 [Candidatus Saccharimonas sp.]|nr:hypothetical protein [Candidatus Saccharimonas sp.]
MIQAASLDELRAALAAPYEGKLDPRRKSHYVKMGPTAMECVYSAKKVAWVMDWSEHRVLRPVTREAIPGFKKPNIDKDHLVMRGPSAKGPGEELDLLRGLAVEMVSPEAINTTGLKPKIADIVRQCLAEQSGVFNLARVTDKVTYLVMCTLLGIEDPYLLSDEHMRMFFRWLDEFSLTPPLLLKPQFDMNQFFWDYIETRLSVALDMPVDRLLRSERLVDIQKLGMLFFLFLSGTQTSSFAIAMAYALMRTHLDPAEYDAWRVKLLGPNWFREGFAIYSESGRFYGSGLGRPHRVRWPMWLAGRPLLPYMFVYACWTSANRDPLWIGQDPDVFRPGRRPLPGKPWFTFGRGSRRCPGQDLSTAVATEFLHQLMELNPELLQASIPPGEYLRWDQLLVG